MDGRMGWHGMAWHGMGCWVWSALSITTTHLLALCCFVCQSIANML